MVNLAGLAPRAAVRAVREQLETAGVPDADFDARTLYAFVTGADSRLCEQPLPAAAAARLARLAARRAAREPLQYLLGEWDFLDFTLKVGPGVLCPRADTEIVCETAVECLRGQPDPAVLDLCAGSGCLGIGIKRFVPAARVLCVEKSGDALFYLRQNALHALPGAAPAVEVLQADVFGCERMLPAGGYALIAANPPYLNAAEMADLMPETAREPALALDGGADGLLFYRYILAQYPAVLRAGGQLVFEIGAAQRAAVSALAQAAGWRVCLCRRDYGGNDRAIVLERA